jgi:uncharacterized protein (TIGR00299 family) protein
MSEALYLESVAGVAGDMFVASFVDAGIVSAAELNALPALVGLAGVGVVVSRVRRAEIAGTHVRVTSSLAGEPPPHPHPDDAQVLPFPGDPAPTGEARAGLGSASTHPLANPTPTAPASDGTAESAGVVDVHLDLARGAHLGGHAHYADIDRRLAESGLEAPVKERARRIFRLVAEAEAAVHGSALNTVDFHEIGAVDSILDVVMAAYCLGKIGSATIYASPIRPGRGLARMAHGTYPIPPPASLRLLAGLPVAPTPAGISRPNVELSTPTGIAILKSIEPKWVDELPEGIVRGQGVGAGTMDLGSFPNVFRLVRLETASPSGGAESFERDRVVEIACNIDDDTAEHVAWLAAQLLERGALDVWLTPLTGKKGRPAVGLSVLAPEAGWAALAAWILENGTTFGVRHRPWDRLILNRRFERRDTAQGPITYKVGMAKDGRVLKAKAEYEELRRTWEDPARP